MTISNVDESVAAEELAPYAWSYQDAENLDYPDGSFDIAVVSAGLHHCRSPHRALLELYRVASVLALEHDSALMRVAVKLGAVDDYELAAVAAHGYRRGASRTRARRTTSTAGRSARSRRPWPRSRPTHAIEIASSASSSCRKPSAIDRGARAQVFRLAAGGDDAQRMLPRQANLFAFLIEKP